MPLEVACPTCAGQFRIPDSAAGKRIRCPKCKGAIEVPVADGEPAGPQAAADRPAHPVAAAGAASDSGPEPAMRTAGMPAPAQRVGADSPASRPAARPPAKARRESPPPEVAEQWYLKTEEGEEYGPVSREELEEWKAEGRVTADCQLLCEGESQWQWASDVYPDLIAEEEEAAEAQHPPAGKRATGKQSPAKQAPAKQATSEKSIGAGKARGAAQARTASAAVDTGVEGRSSRSRLMAGLLGVFLGPLGIHRFYLGYWVIGLIMLATGGACGIWSLIDAIFVFLGKVADADGRALGD